jgi:hypothetical protein
VTLRHGLQSPKEVHYLEALDTDFDVAEYKGCVNELGHPIRFVIEGIVPNDEDDKDDKSVDIRALGIEASSPFPEESDGAIPSECLRPGREEPIHPSRSQRPSTN